MYKVETAYTKRKYALYMYCIKENRD